ncbi:hypothetical protein M2451_001689 [Dysgonomonas sp. PFB1-18]|uniref:porin family protein n=1 Tax=unclassified Dysgonomonas TaxID=2630389 RepID=UPI0024739553|nr:MULTISPECIES: porin family protein [unclassified Dysgonomonas]MDL2303487.1 PorT family protein [Dysgonomonas sp. OttesenSCG-928-D17]MDH6309118.1 hypothetical protein [Dysgonomonas sp. PF1-14]MDH6339002.1 hypothetical protein [Dysgonomonas sp. PF1-16]MDH6380367.1 hypothetical protein [Dysgonomonas sp. PFB1-18]MDH6397830.1 hypothetical protein [Dysgonomonas sp. PF1-23]
MNTLLKILISTCVLIVISSGSELKAQKRRITSDFVFGLNFAEMDIEGANMYKKPKIGFLIGTNVNFKLISNFQVQTGFFVAKKGLRQDIEVYEEDKAAGQTTTEYTMRNTVANYIQVPLGIGYEVYLTRSFALNINAGGYAAYGFKGDHKIEEYTVITLNGTPYTSAIVETEIDTFSKRMWKRLDYGAYARVGAIYDIFTINLTYEYGLHNVSNEGSIMKNRNLAVALGFRF